MRCMTTEQLVAMRLRGEDFMLVNTLDADEYSEQQIPGSYNVPESASDFSEQVLELCGSKQRLTVVYCRPGDNGCSKRAAEKLARDRFNVARYAGGVASWREATDALAV